MGSPFWQTSLVADADERESELEYLPQVELLARDIVDRALDEGWLSFARDPDDATPLEVRGPSH
ncbi:hypothetical protein B0I29_101631 [Actinoplanes lutulentus]|uniref:Uncharacterized protein n=1 Tax=Actinoplanes lutulentus TaxID=1287878 RepID=A0A327ZM32_9ACTN|nr:hypothetical protein [Actinoplanes lutulentus]RAK43501.1 hypothetical protein B0I29_101631 [Actinoplanes lutulentus]